MMTPQQLNRATPGFRSGYSDATRNMPCDPSHGGAHACGIWWSQDYHDGYKAGLIAMRRFR